MPTWHWRNRNCGPMDKRAMIFVAGHRGMVGSAIVRRLREAGFTNLLLAERSALDLCDQAAAQVGGIVANDTLRGQFIRDNLLIQTNVIHEAHTSGVRRLLFLGSTCIYPKFAPQPMREEYLLSGPLEPT